MEEQTGLIDKDTSKHETDFLEFLVALDTSKDQRVQCIELSVGLVLPLGRLKSKDDLESFVRPVLIRLDVPNDSRCINKMPRGTLDQRCDGIFIRPGRRKVL